MLNSFFASDSFTCRTHICWFIAVLESQFLLWQLMFSLQVKRIKPRWNSSWRKKELQTETCIIEKQKLWVFRLLLLLLLSSLLSLGLWYVWDLKEVRSSFQPSLVIRGRKWPEMLLSLRCNKEHLKMILCYFWMYIKYLHAVYDPIVISKFPPEPLWESFRCADSCKSR